MSHYCSISSSDHRAKDLFWPYNERETSGSEDSFFEGDEAFVVNGKWLRTALSVLKKNEILTVLRSGYSCLTLHYRECPESAHCASLRSLFMHLKHCLFYPGLYAKAF